jgi:hypothetical protein
MRAESRGTDFGADPDWISFDHIEQIEKECSELKSIGANCEAIIGSHPTLGNVLILKDKHRGCVIVDRVTFT